MRTKPELWQRLEAMKFEQAAVPFGFANRLARDNGWSLEFANRIIDEYKKFAYLAVATDHEVTPSDEVDQAWHLHLTYTRHYWGEFTEILGEPLHHGPTQGTGSDKLRFDDNYTNTKASYQKEFGHPPPDDIWPSAEIRFGHAPFYQRVNTKTHLTVPVPSFVRNTLSSPLIRKGAVMGSIGLGTISLAHAATQVASEQSAGNGTTQLMLLAGFLLFMTVILLASLARKKSSNSKNAGAAGGVGCSTGGKGDGGDGGGSGCGSGCGGGGCGG